MRDRGFTLIELLVVIAIIGLLSSIVLAAVSTARANANNAKFALEMRSLVSAISLYRTNTGTIPGLGLGWTFNDADTSLDTNLASLITDKDISRIPHYTGWVSGASMPAYILYYTNAANYTVSCGAISSNYVGVIAILGNANLGLKLPKQDVWKSNSGTPALPNTGSQDVYCIPISI